THDLASGTASGRPASRERGFSYISLAPAETKRALLATKRGDGFPGVPPLSRQSRFAALSALGASRRAVQRKATRSSTLPSPQMEILPRQTRRRPRTHVLISCIVSYELATD